MNPKIFSLLVAIVCLVPANQVLIAQTPSGNPSSSSNQPGKTHHKNHHKSRNPSPDKILKRMTKTLDLTLDQQNKIRPILENSHQQIATILNNPTVSEDEKKQQLKDVKTSTRAEILPLLTPAQQEMAKNLKHHHKSKQPKL